MKDSTLKGIDKIIELSLFFWFMYVIVIMFINETATMFFTITMFIILTASFSNYHKGKIRKLNNR